MTLQGKLIEIFPTKEITDKFRKREFVVEYAENAEYTQTIQLELQQDNCSALDNYRTGDYVDVTFDLRGRKWVNPSGEAKYFNTLVAFRIAKVKTEEVQSDISGIVQPDNPDLPF